MATLFRSFLRADRSGAAAIEFAIVLPVILLMFLGGNTLFDMLRAYNKVLQSNGIVADLVTRQSSVDASFLDLVYNASLRLQDENIGAHALRITSVTYSGNKYQAAWTRELGDTGLLAEPALSPGTLPEIPEGESVIFVESTSTYTPLTGYLGFKTLTFSESVFARPRSVSAIAYQ